MPTIPYKRIVVIGTTGSGKSTMAAKLAYQFSLPFIELDALHWEPDWKEAPDEVFRERVSCATQAPKWIVAGNYHVVRDLVWPRAEAIIWLDYPLLVILMQLLRRTVKRWWTQDLLWGSNREPFWIHFKVWSKESLIHWLFLTYWRRKRETPLLLSLPEHNHLTLIYLRHPEEAEQWLDSIRGLPVA